MKGLRVVLLFCVLVLAEITASNSVENTWTAYSAQKAQKIAQQVNTSWIKQELELHWQTERVVGTESHDRIEMHIIDFFNEMGSDWVVETDSFTASTPLGLKTFSNIIATYNPHFSDRRIVLAAHYDSKYFAASRDRPFIGATDSAVPCVLLMELVQSLRPLLSRSFALWQSDWKAPALQIVLFDGEEAFETWTPADSIYGARHLADRWRQDDRITSISAFILLDLIGAPNLKLQIGRAHV